jgi:hypothetical protein
MIFICDVLNRTIVCFFKERVARKKKNNNEIVRAKIGQKNAYHCPCSCVCVFFFEILELSGLVSFIHTRKKKYIYVYHIYRQTEEKKEKNKPG